MRHIHDTEPLPAFSYSELTWDTPAAYLKFALQYPTHRLIVCGGGGQAALFPRILEIALSCSHVQVMVMNPCSAGAYWALLIPASARGLVNLTMKGEIGLHGFDEDLNTPADIDQLECSVMGDIFEVFNDHFEDWDNEHQMRALQLEMETLASVFLAIAHAGKDAWTYLLPDDVYAITTPGADDEANEKIDRE